MSSKKYDDVSVFYDKSHNRYGAKITLEKGKPRKTVYGKTEEETLLKARKLLYGTRDEKFIVSKGMPLAELLKFNLERKDNAGKVGDAQYARTIYTIKQIEKFEISAKNVIDITEKDYQDFFNQLAKEYADTSIDKCYSEINQALKYAKKKKIIEDNTLEDIIKPKSKIAEKEIITLTTKQQKILTDYLFGLNLKKYKFKNVFLIQLYMGLRIGEALALKKSDIDLKHKKMHIQRTITQTRNNEYVLGKMPKTFAGNRILPIPDIIYNYVKEQVEISNNNMQNLLFVNNNKLVRHTCINDQLKRRLVNLGIYEPGMSPHSLRHTYATRCIESKMQPIVLSKLLGHSDIRVTLNTYVKIFNEYQTKVSKEVEEYYKNINLTKNGKEIDDIDDIDDEELEIEETKGAKIIPFPKIVNDYDR